MSNELSRRTLLRRSAAGAGIGAAALAVPSITKASVAPVFAGAASSGVQEFNIELLPTGEPGSSGSITVTLDATTGESCWEITALDINDPNNNFTLLHIHEGAAGVNGGVVIGFNNTLAGCVDASVAQVQEICDNPENFYVNLHTADAPGGAIRNQLA